MMVLIGDYLENKIDQMPLSIMTTIVSLPEIDI